MTISPALKLRHLPLMTVRLQCPYHLLICINESRPSPTQVAHPESDQNPAQIHKSTTGSTYNIYTMQQYVSFTYSAPATYTSRTAEQSLSLLLSHNNILHNRCWQYYQGWLVPDRERTAHLRKTRASAGKIETRRLPPHNLRVGTVQQKHFF